MVACTPYQVSGMHGAGVVEAVEITHHDSGDVERLEVDEVVAALGFIAELGPLTEWGMALSQRHIVVDTTMATNVPRIFAAGDITEYPGKVRLISVGPRRGGNRRQQRGRRDRPEAQAVPRPLLRPREAARVRRGRVARPGGAGPSRAGPMGSGGVAAGRGRAAFRLALVCRDNAAEQSIVKRELPDAASVPASGRRPCGHRPSGTHGHVAGVPSRCGAE